MRQRTTELPETPIGSTMTNLRCTYCGTEYDADILQTLCPKDGRVLAPQYDLNVRRGR